MYQDRRVISVTPAGRKRYLEILAPYLLRERGLIDKHIFWINTNNEEDISYIKELCTCFPDFFEYRELPPGTEYSNYTIHNFFPECTDRNTIYIRLDDDICWIDSDCILELLKLRYDDHTSFIVYGNTINNAICSHLHARIGAMHLANGMPTYNCMCELGWRNSEYAKAVHINFLRKLEAQESDDYKFAREWILGVGETRMSINAISWHGGTFAKFEGKIDRDEELDLSLIRPRDLKVITKIAGRALLCHFAFYTQRSYLESVGILQKYSDISAQLASDLGIILPK